MPLTVRRGSGAVEYALASQLDALRRVVAQGAGQFHLEVSSVGAGDFTNPTAVPLTLASGPASDLPSLLSLCQELAGRHAAHTHDRFAHLKPDTADDLAKGPPATLADAVAFLNDAKAKFNAHLSQAGVHVVNDPNKITAPDAADQQTACDLANTYRALYNAHIQAAPPGFSVDLIGP
ncbi:MAG TPA: hypothetical protein VGG39_37700 [Polyangiaceae bacterium]|jgi:hypothetical protein